MTDTNLDAFKGKDSAFVADYLKAKAYRKRYLYLLPVLLVPLAMEGPGSPWCFLLKHVYIHSFRSIIEATEKLKQ